MDSGRAVGQARRWTGKQLAERRRQEQGAAGRSTEPAEACGTQHERGQGHDSSGNERAVVEAHRSQAAERNASEKDTGRQGAREH